MEDKEIISLDGALSSSGRPLEALASWTELVKAVSSVSERAREKVAGELP